MKTYSPPSNRPREALKQAGFKGPKAHRSAPVFPHIVPLALAPRGPGASLGAVGPPPLGDKGPAADGAKPHIRGRALGAEGGLERRIGGQDGLPEVAAQGPRPALAQHIALAVQGQAPIFPVIVGAQGNHQPADRGPFLAGQFPAHSSGSPSPGSSSSQGGPSP